MWYVKDLEGEPYFPLQKALGDALMSGAIPRDVVMLVRSIRSNIVYIKTNSPAVVAIMGGGFAPTDVSELPRKPMILISDGSYP